MPTYTDEEMEQFLHKNVRSQGFNGWLKPDPHAYKKGEIEFTLKVREEMTQHHGYVHGGILATLADNACAWVGASATGMDVVTSSINIHYMAPARGTVLRVKGRAIRAGKRIATTHADVYIEAEGKSPVHCAHAVASIAILEPRE
ncbi:MAG: PaaI family thioesterase [Paracoccaceae bacterium]